jgi:hypothetical protein
MGDWVGADITLLNPTQAGATQLDFPQGGWHLGDSLNQLYRRPPFLEDFGQPMGPKAA